MKKIIVVIFISLILFSGTIKASVINQAPAGVLPISQGTKLVPLDWDLDGDLDLVLLRKAGRDSPASVMFFLNDAGVYTFSSFWDFLDYSVNYNAIYAGDLNNDGWQDLVLNKQGKMIRSVLNNYGGFDEHTSAWTYTNNSQVQDILLADFNNDGYLDLAVANYSNNNWIFKGNGDGTFSSTPDLVLPGTNYTVAIAAADMNNDGNIDLICANDTSFTSNIVYLLNGNFGTNNTFFMTKIPGKEYAKSIAIGDVNNDGYFDVLIGCADTNNNGTVQILTNNGTGKCFNKGVSGIGIFSGNPVNIDVADINADGILDMLVTIENQEAKVFIGSNNGNYVLDSHPAGDMYAIFCDYDNDSDLDVVLSHIHNNTSKIISWTGMGFSGSPGVEKSLKFSDDQVLMQTYNQIIIGRPNMWSGSASFDTNYKKVFTKYIESVAVGDVNGVLSFQDKDDYIIGTRDGWIYVYTNTSPPHTNIVTFNLFWSNRVDNLAGITGYKASAMALGDINGDGAPDLVFQALPTNDNYSSSDTNAGAFILLNAGSNCFNTNAIKIPLIQFGGQPLPMPADTFLIEDIDDDSDNDIIAGTGGPDWIAYNKGQGIFDETTFQYPESGETKCIALGDIDGDGDLDLVRGNAGNPVDYSYGYENINGIFSYDTIWQSPTLYAASSMIFVDVDKDSDVDLCFANNIEVEESFIMENKNGVLGTTKDDYLWASSDPNKPPSFGIKYSGIIVQDLDGDNDDDIFLIAGTGQTNCTNKIFKGLYYENFQVEASNLPNVPAFAEIGFSDLPTNNSMLIAYPISIIGYDRDNVNATNYNLLVRFQVSLTGGSTWEDVPPIDFFPTDSWIRPGPLPTSFFVKATKNGFTNHFIWDVPDIAQGARFVIRLITYPQYNRCGKIHHSAYVHYEKATFYVNGHPNAFISSPVEGGTVSGTVEIMGGAYDYDFTKYVITIKKTSNTNITIVSYTNTSPVPPVGHLYSWDTSSLSNGSYTIHLDVYDRLGQVEFAIPVTVNVVRSGADSPTITAVYPADGAVDVPANSPIIAQFSRYMNVNTMRNNTMQVTYNKQQELNGNATYKNLVKSLIFDANPNLEFNAVHLTSIDGDFKDILGNKIGNDYMWSFKTEKGLPTSIVKGYPTGEDVETNTVIKVYYNVDMSSYTNFNDNTFYVQDVEGNKVSGTVSSFNPISNTVTFTPNGGLKGSTIYIVTIKKEIIPDVVPYPYSWYFITKDTIKPQIVSTTPSANEDFFDPTQEIRIKFNKTMNVNQLQENIFELKQGNTIIDGSLTYDIKNNILIFEPKEPLEGLTKYTGVVYSKFEDMGGQLLGYDYKWNFRTTQILTSEGGSLSSSDNKVKIRMPKNAVTSKIAISISKLDESEIPAPKNNKIKSIGIAYRFYPEGTKFNKPLTIQLAYPDANNNGLVDSITTGLDIYPNIYENKLAIFYYDEKIQKYERIGGTVDAKNNTVAAAINHFSIFGIFEDLNSYSDDLAITEINTYPRIFNPDTDGYMDINFNVKLKNSATATVKVYNLAGRLVKIIAEDMKLGYGYNYVQWDGRDKDNDIVHNRMYVLLIIAKDDTGNKVRKTKTFVVER